MSKIIHSYRDLKIYQSSFAFQQEIFRHSKKWPPEEKYALKDQIRRSSRSIGANITEAWAKRRYPMHFISKLTDADGELQETQHWIETARACDYLSREAVGSLLGQADEIGGMLGAMIAKADKFVPHSGV